MADPHTNPTSRTGGDSTAQALKTEGVKKGFDTLLRLLKVGGGDFVSEVAGMYGYHGLQHFIKKWRGEGGHGDKPETPEPRKLNGTEVNITGKGYGDEAILMMEALAAKDLGFIEDAEFLSVVEWLASQHKSVRERFRLAFIAIEDQEKRLDLLARFTKLSVDGTDDQRALLLKALNIEAPHDYVKDLKEDTKKLLALIRTNVPKALRYTTQALESYECQQRRDNTKLNRGGSGIALKLPWRTEGKWGSKTFGRFFEMK